MRCPEKYLTETMGKWESSGAWFDYDRDGWLDLTSKRNGVGVVGFDFNRRWVAGYVHRCRLDVFVTYLDLEFNRLNRNRRAGTL